MSDNSYLSYKCIWDAVISTERAIEDDDLPQFIPQNDEIIKREGFRVIPLHLFQEISQIVISDIFFQLQEMIRCFNKWIQSADILLLADQISFWIIDIE